MIARIVPDYYFAILVIIRYNMFNHKIIAGHK